MPGIFTNRTKTGISNAPHFVQLVDCKVGVYLLQFSRTKQETKTGGGPGGTLKTEHRVKAGKSP